MYSKTRHKNGQETGRNIMRAHFTKDRNKKKGQKHLRYYKMLKGEKVQMEIKCIMELVK